MAKEKNIKLMEKFILGNLKLIAEKEREIWKQINLNMKDNLYKIESKDKGQCVSIMAMYM